MSGLLALQQSDLTILIYNIVRNIRSNGPMLRVAIHHLFSNILQLLCLRLLLIFSINLKDKTIGIIGVGNVGSKVEKFARTIGMNVLLNDPPRARREGS